MPDSDEKLSMLFFRDAKGDLTKKPILSNIPDDLLKNSNDDIAQLMSELKASHRDFRAIKTEPEIRKDAAKCGECNLCMVCAGNHRRYESWPPGTGQCFVTFTKKGKPLRNKPCELCEVHDKEMRDFKRSWQRGLSNSSRLKNKLNGAIVARRNLFKQYQINCDIISE